MYDKIFRRELFRRLALLLAGSTCGVAWCDEPQERAPKLEFSHEPQAPSQIPLQPGLNIGRSFYSYDEDPPRPGKRYEPADDGGYTIHNGPDTYNHILMGEGVWYLLVGDKPRFRLFHRTGEGSYAQPGILPDLGVDGRLRLAITARGKLKWLDQFDSIDTHFAPGVATWHCSDAAVGANIELSVRALISWNGFIATLKARSDSADHVGVTWALGGIQDKGNAVEPKTNYARLSNSALPYTEVFAGPVEGECQVGSGPVRILFDSDDPPAATTHTAEPCALYNVMLPSDPAKTVTTRLLCVWGYRDYNRQGVTDAYARLEGKPFADTVWAEEMKKQWFHHWIGRGLEAEKKFLEVRGQADDAAQESVRFWESGKRIRITTPDARFDNVVNNEAANLRHQFEYPAFIHGLIGWAKYGKINCGYYGPEAAGYHEEVENSLKFISGAQDAKGRQCYFTPAFATLHWAEEVDFYYVEQVWRHYRWTGRLDFLKVMWPSVRRSLEHALAASDPDGDGIMTGFYEFWNNDTHSRGGKCAVQTAMAWAALRSATEIAKRVGAQSSAARYETLTEQVYAQLQHHLWSAEVGAYCSAEWNGSLRPHPEAQEQFLPIMRDAGGPMEKYMGVRYVRDNLFLRPQPGVTLELMNDWWPIAWSHQYVANGDTALSVLAGLKAGDVDNYWPALKTISESAYLSQSATLRHSQRNDGVGVGMKDIAELQAPFIQAVAEGLFGLEPDFGDNLLTLRPNFPSHWEHASVATPDLSYAYRREGDTISVTCQTPVERKLRLEFPVRGGVKRVAINEKDAQYSIESGVNGARIVVESDIGKTHRFRITVGESVRVEGKAKVLRAETARFIVHGATLRRVLDPQGKVRDIAIRRRSEDSFEASFVPTQEGRCTLFLELESGRSSYLHALDLEVFEPWSIVRKYLPAFCPDGPAVSSPSIDWKTKTVLIELENHTEKELSGPATITVAGKIFREPLHIPPGGTGLLRLSIADIWSRLSPGSISARVEIAGGAETCEAVNWELGKDKTIALGERLHRVDLKQFYNIDLTTLFGDSSFQWRLDYTGCGVGVDWRDPMPEKDRLGYVLMRPPLSQLTWTCLPENRLTAGPGSGQTPHWEIPDLHRDFETPVGVPFLTDEETRVLALNNTEPRGLLPSAAILRLERPVRLEKVYLLTANLTKTLKCYYPGGEVIVYYAGGERQVIQLIPPYSMSCMAQHFSPKSYAIPFGKLVGSPVIPKPESVNLAVSDLLLDPEKSVSHIEFRCVASETIFGILGVTLLAAN
jgi:hypothetical protein